MWCTMVSRVGRQKRTKRKCAAVSSRTYAYVLDHVKGFVTYAGFTRESGRDLSTVAIAHTLDGFSSPWPLALGRLLSLFSALTLTLSSHPRNRRPLFRFLSYHPDWIAIRASFGMNGIFLQDRDVVLFADYLERHQKRRPPDHLVVREREPEREAYPHKHNAERGREIWQGTVHFHFGDATQLRTRGSDGVFFYQRSQVSPPHPTPLK